MSAAFLIAGFALGWFGSLAYIRWVDRRTLPPATTRQIRRAAHDKLADLSEVRTALPLTEPRPTSVRLVPIYIKTEGPAPSAPIGCDDFDANGETRP